MRTTLIILLFFIAGIIAGILNTNTINIDSNFSVYLLYVLMFLVGVSVGGDKRSGMIFSQLNFGFVFLPVLTIIGTWIGAFIISFLISDLCFRDILAVSTGFGYYSLSSVIIAESKGAELGTIALISNIIREIATLVFTPLLVKYLSSLSAISSAGATSMDTTLPVITRYAGKEYAIISVFHGTILTLVMPFLLSLILLL